LIHVYCACWILLCKVHQLLVTRLKWLQIGKTEESWGPDKQWYFRVIIAHNLTPPYFPSVVFHIHYIYNHLEVLNIKFAGDLTYFWKSELIIMLEQLEPVFRIYVWNYVLIFNSQHNLCLCIVYISHTFRQAVY
jgi:hypothetical protein